MITSYVSAFKTDEAATATHTVTVAKDKLTVDTITITIVKAGLAFDYVFSEMERKG